MQIGEKLRKIRIERGLNQPAAAERIGIQQSYLSKIENNHSTPSSEILQRIEQAYAINLHEMLDDFDAINNLLKVKKTQDVKFLPPEQAPPHVDKNQETSQHGVQYKSVISILLALGLILFLISLFVSQNSRTIYVTQTLVAKPFVGESGSQHSINVSEKGLPYQFVHQIHEVYDWPYYVVFGVSLGCFIVSLCVYLMQHMRQRKKATDP